MSADEKSGSAISSVGDINEDGYDDFIIGAPYATFEEKYAAGASYVIFGKTHSFEHPLMLSSLNGINGFLVVGKEAYDWSGISVSAAGDINGDGYDDLIIGASGADTNNEFTAGVSYVIYGKPSGFTSFLRLADLDEQSGFKIFGERENDRSGYPVRFAGDINGDGYDDLIIGAENSNLGTARLNAGRSYVLFGNKLAFERFCEDNESPSAFMQLLPSILVIVVGPIIIVSCAKLYRNCNKHKNPQPPVHPVHIPMKDRKPKNVPNFIAAQNIFEANEQDHAEIKVREPKNVPNVIAAQNIFEANPPSYEEAVEELGEPHVPDEANEQDPAEIKVREPENVLDGIAIQNIFEPNPLLYEEKAEKSEEPYVSAEANKQDYFEQQFYLY